FSHCLEHALGCRLRRRVETSEHFLGVIVELLFQAAVVAELERGLLGTLAFLGRSLPDPVEGVLQQGQLIGPTRHLTQLSFALSFVPRREILEIVEKPRYQARFDLNPADSRRSDDGLLAL